MRVFILGLFLIIGLFAHVSNAVMYDTTPRVVPMTKKNCFSIDGFYVGEESGECSSICPNRIKKEGWCMLKKCPPDKLIQTGIGDCHSCDETDVIYMGHSEECESVCPNRYRTYQGICHLKKCPSDKPLQDDLGECFGCDETRAISVRKNQKCEEICPNRTINAYEACVLKKCPSSAPLEDAYGACYPCDTLLRVNSKKCKWTCHDRTDKNGYCEPICGQGVFKKFPISVPDYSSFGLEQGEACRTVAE